MNCVICKYGQTRADRATITLECDGLTLVVRSVPAQVCENCGEEYVDEDITADLLEQASQAVRSGVRLEVRDFVVA